MVNSLSYVIDLIKKEKVTIMLSLILISPFFNAQEVGFWNKILKTNIIIHQKVTDDSTYVFIDKKENKWLGSNVNIKTVNYWNNASIDISADCCKKNILIIKRTFLGNNMVGDQLYFKKNKNKYYFKTLKEFEQKSE
ncbi:hypothetical protein [Chryseobacterium joostei]|uniref:hypothetical protein n=1 Tax=Chryseobacterium joostei TaxID=112234 RepID=UPI0023F2F623|nr:hypothetical protein [Chryseobacterium joostei]